MNIRNEREDIGKLNRGTDAEKIENKTNVFRKAEKLLVEGLSVALVVAGLGLGAQGCGSAPNTREDGGDARTTRLDGYTSPEEELNSEIEEDATEGDGVADVPDVIDDEVAEVVEEDATTEEDVSSDGEMDVAPDAEEDTTLDAADGVEDTAVDPTEEDVIEDFVSDLTEEEISEDVVSDLTGEDSYSDLVSDEGAEDVYDDETEEDINEDESSDLLWDEVSGVCDPFNQILTVWIDDETSEMIGGVEVIYRGVGGEGRGVYDVVCGGELFATISVEEGHSETREFAESGFGIVIIPHSVTSWRTNATIEIYTFAPRVEEDDAYEGSGVCSAVDELADVWISAGGTETVGGIGVRYNGQDTFGNGLYDIVCGDVTVRSGIAAAPLTSELVDVPEHSFSVTLRPNTVSSIRSNVTVTVDAY